MLCQQVECKDSHWFAGRSKLPEQSFTEVETLCSSKPEDLTMLINDTKMREPCSEEEKKNLDPTMVDNYRPVSNLPFLSKILEKKIAFNQLNSFLKSRAYFRKISVWF